MSAPVPRVKLAMVTKRMITDGVGVLKPASSLHWIGA